MSEIARVIITNDGTNMQVNGSGFPTATPLRITASSRKPEDPIAKTFSVAVQVSIDGTLTLKVSNTLFFTQLTSVAEQKSFISLTGLIIWDDPESTVTPGSEIVAFGCGNQLLGEIIISVSA